MKIGEKWLSLNALRAFEATGRHLHMGRAANELGITQSAVSHQIRQLESTLGIELFIRTGRALRLSSAGAKLLTTVQRSFDAIASTIFAVNQDLVHGELKIATEPGFTYHWLASRLPRFLNQHPGLALRREAVPKSENDLDISIDVAVAQSNHAFHGRRVEFLAQLIFFPVCSASLVKDASALEPKDIKDFTIIHGDDGLAWSHWFAHFGVDQTPAKCELYVGSHPVACSLARSGVGFALGEGNFGAEMLGGGLVRPFDESAEIYDHYYLITHVEGEMSAAAKEFETWLRSEIERSIGA